MLIVQETDMYFAKCGKEIPEGSWFGMHCSKEVLGYTLKVAQKIARKAHLIRNQRIALSFIVVALIFISFSFPIFKASSQPDHGEIENRSPSKLISRFFPNNAPCYCLEKESESSVIIGEFY